MEFQDKVLKCVDCETEFVFTIGEQLFFRERQFRNEPKRCRSCKGKRVSVMDSASAKNKFPRVETHATCSRCGKDTTVPFIPTQGRPVLCRDCFLWKRTEASA